MRAGHILVTYMSEQLREHLVLHSDYLLTIY
jgi:hypothetical protein